MGTLCTTFEISCTYILSYFKIKSYLRKRERERDRKEGRKKETMDPFLLESSWIGGRGKVGDSKVPPEFEQRSLLKGNYEKLTQQTHPKLEFIYEETRYINR